MKFVLDASVALKWVLSEVDSPIALRLHAEMAAGLHLAYAPDPYPVEVGHALTRAERQGIIPVGNAFINLYKILATPPVLFDSLRLLPRAVVISSSHRMGLYDCLYVALAEQLGCELVTADDKLVKNGRPIFPFIVPLADFP